MPQVPSAAITPLTVWGDNCKLWCRSDVLASVGGVIPTWADQTGPAHPLEQSTAGSRPAYVASGTPSGMPCARSDGSKMLRAQFALAQPYYVAVVAKWTLAASIKYLVDGYDGINYCAIYNDNNASPIKTHAGDFIGGPSAAYTSGTWALIEVYFDDAGVSGIAINGAAWTTGAIGTRDPGGITLFAAGDGASYGATADVSEIVVCNRLPTPAERAAYAPVAMAWSGVG